VKGMQVAAVIVAAGYGKRFNKFRKKQFLPLGGKPLLYWTLEVFQKVKQIDGIILVLPRGDISRQKKIIQKKFGKVKEIVPGGRLRQESVFNGLKKVGERFSLVAIHDGVRPLVSTGLIERTLRIAKKYGSAVTALLAKETVKLAKNKNIIERTLPREKIWLIQTPQVFPREVLLKAYQKAQKDRFTATDDAQLVERLGYLVKLVPGEETNIKITTSEDLLFAETILSQRTQNTRKERKKLI